MRILEFAAPHPPMGESEHRSVEPTNSRPFPSESNLTYARPHQSRTAITHITVKDFRCFGYLQLTFDGRPVVLTGANGAGKTNFLEAVSMLGPGRGIRGARLDCLDRHGTHDSQGWAITAHVNTSHGACEISTWRKDERREIMIDGQNAKSQAVLSENLNVLWLVPSMDRLFVDRASARRRFLDRLVLGIDAQHARRLSAYERAMRDRARLLRSGVDRADRTWLSVLESTMAGQGIAVAAARRTTVSKLLRILKSDPGPFPAAEISLSGRIAAWLDDMPAVDAEARLADSLAESRWRDAETGGASEGPHRDDFSVCKDGLPAEDCSTGEQKSLLISVFLAGARLLLNESGRHPILLLDDAGAHLDSDHRTALFEAMTRLGGQTWLSGTDRAHFSHFGDWAQFFEFNRGNVRRG